MKLLGKALLLAGTATFAPATAALAETAESAESQALAPDPDEGTIIVTGTVLQSNQINSVKTPTPIIDVPQSLSTVSYTHLTLPTTPYV